MAATTNPKAPANATNKAPQSATKADEIDFSTWEEEQVGFAPYWNPEPGKFFVGTPVARDERDPSFLRYLIKAAVDTQCKRGPVDEAEEVLVKKGEFFSVSVYYALAEPFDAILENFTSKGTDILAKVTAIKTAKTKEKNDVWQWKMHLPPEHKKLMTAMKETVRKAALAEANERKAIEQEAGSSVS